MILFNRFTASIVCFAALALTISTQASAPIYHPPADWTPPPSDGELRTKRAALLEQTKQTSCLAKTIWGEARSESLLGQELVATVIMNRVDSERYPDTICEVVQQRKQFSTWNPNDPNVPKMHKAFLQESYDETVMSAIRVAVKLRDMPANERILPASALHYHATRVSPKWADKLEVFDTVGLHIFYSNS